MLNFFVHWFELKYRLIYFSISLVITFGICFLSNDFYIYIISTPFFNIYKKCLYNDKGFIFTSITEAFNTSLFTCINLSIIFNIPFFFYLLYHFLKPGLFKKEKVLLNLLIYFELSSFVVSCLFTYLFLLPNIYYFFLSFEQLEQNNLFRLSLEAKISDFIYTTFNFFWLSFLMFQIPLFFILSLYFNLFKVTSLLEKRREILLFFFILGALIAPPDVLSQLIIVGFLCCIFEFISFSFILKNTYQNYVYRYLRELLER